MVLEGNEPTLHVPYYFALLNEPVLGAEWIEDFNNRYNDTPDGLAGNDDGEPYLHGQYLHQWDYIRLPVARIMSSVNRLEQSRDPQRKTGHHPR